MHDVGPQLGRRQQKPSLANADLDLDGALGAEDLRPVETFQSPFGIYPEIRLDDDALSEIRASRIGFVFQSYNLIPQLTVLENIEVPLYYQKRITSADRERSEHLAEMVGLADRLAHRPTQLSGGQQQRVAIARSLINDPFFILADEPTGNLDTATTKEILDLLERLNNDGKTIIMVTHEPEVGQRTKRTIRLRDGLVISDERREALSTASPDA